MEVKPSRRNRRGILTNESAILYSKTKFMEENKMNEKKLVMYFVVLCLLSFYVLGAESSTVGNAMASFYKLNITMVNH